MVEPGRLDDDLADNRSAAVTTLTAGRFGFTHVCVEKKHPDAPAPCGSYADAVAALDARIERNDAGAGCCELRSL